MYAPSLDAWMPVTLDRIPITVGTSQQWKGEGEGEGEGEGNWITKEDTAV